MIKYTQRVVKRFTWGVVNIPHLKGQWVTSGLDLFNFIIFKKWFFKSEEKMKGIWQTDDSGSLSCFLPTLLWSTDPVKEDILL